MNKIEVYQCSFCKAVYKKEDDAVKCEKGHRIPAGFVQYVFEDSRLLEDNTYPIQISVRFNDGEEKQYKLFK